MSAKYVFVTGGVISGIGKGITTASVGRLLKDRGIRIGIVKMDPYINVDAGLMNPFQHGEVFVTNDGAETDLDLGHYERFIDQPLSRASNVTTGQVYGEVIAKERDGNYYLGHTVQVIPHITDEIKSRIRLAAKKQDAELLIVEIGGTVGDIEGQPFLEAIRQMRIDEGPENVCFVHVTLVPFVGTVGELKTKPTQHSVRELRGVGIQPDIIVARTQGPIDEGAKRKLALFCDVPASHIIEAQDTSASLYEIPMLLEQQGIADLICKEVGIPPKPAQLGEWQAMVDRIKHPSRTVPIAMVGKYMDLKDAYLSVTEALKHGGIANDCAVEIRYVDSEDVERDGPEAHLAGVHGVLVPGGFGDRGIEGKIAAIGYARENCIPYLGLCLGLQTACIEFARNVCGLEGADSREFKQDAAHPVIIYLKEQEYVTELGGTMRLGAYPCVLQEGSLAARLYGTTEIQERHRHRLEVSNAYRKTLADCGLVFSGTSPEGDLVEIIEYPEHPFFIATQFHPEFQSRPNRAHPLFRGLVEAALKRQSECGRE
ncbi:MAG: CTP synthase [Armatimonadetes bacterium]|nr:CTP synthase [Armatimonadota bacterium]MDI9583394.1 CTP synthase [Acidobacteriota bacterium]